MSKNKIIKLYNYNIILTKYLSLYNNYKDT